MTPKPKRAVGIPLQTSNQNFHPKKHLGQNFLVDHRVKDKIFTSCELEKSDTILEIGPGLGALTDKLISEVKHVIAIEKDAHLANELQSRYEGKNVTVIHADFLKYPLNKLPKNLKVIGNLPYYISSPIIEKIVCAPEHFSQLFLTIQYELGQRLIAKVNTKAYGSFTCFIQYHASAQVLFRIKNTAFRPIPKVQSCFLRLDITKKPPFPCKNSEFLFQLIRQAFQQRRKTIRKSLEPLAKKEPLIKALEDLDLDPKMRAENLTLKNYVELANLLGKSKKK